MIGAILGAAQVGLGLYDAFQGNKEAKRAGRRADEEFAEIKRRNDRNEAITDAELQRFNRIRDAEEQRFNDRFDPIEQQLAQEVSEGEDIEGAAQQASGDFVGEFDRATEASRRQFARNGIAPGSSAAASFEEDTAFNRARGSATAATEARRFTDDQNFIRRTTFLNSGQGLRDRAARQFSGSFDTSSGLYNIQADQAATSAASANAGIQSVGQGLGALANIQETNARDGRDILGRRTRQPTGDAANPNLNNLTNDTNGLQSRTTQGVNGAIAAQTRVDE